jgi:hypothetical protein
MPILVLSKETELFQNLMALWRETKKRL